MSEMRSLTSDKKLHLTAGEYKPYTLYWVIKSPTPYIGRIDRRIK